VQVRNIPAEWKRLFMEAGVKKSELQVRLGFALLEAHFLRLSLSTHLCRSTPPHLAFFCVTTTSTRTRRPGRPSSTPFASLSTARRPRLHPAVRASTR
jgi:hypothetical protein